MRIFKALSKCIIMYILVMSICYILSAIIVFSIKIIDVFISIIKGMKNEKRYMD